MFAWLAFALCVLVITVAGAKLCHYGDIIADKTGLGGTWIGLVMVATVTNLERHDRPARPFVLEHDELGQLVPSLSIRHHSETWRPNGRHEAHLVACRT